MPIYAYKCTDCGHELDVLQKVSDAPLTVCPSCGATTFSKQVTAAGFQLKGSGWYATDFRDAGKKKDGAAKDKAADAPADAKTEAKADGADSKSATGSSAASASASESKSETKSPPPPPSAGN